MEKKLHTIFRESTPRPNEPLSDAIWEHIVKIDQRRRRTAAWIYASVSVLSFAALFPVISELITEIAKSGFSEYVSVAFSDTAVLGTYWKELALSIVDALPVTTLIVSFALLFVFFLSIARLANRLRVGVALA